MCNRLNHLEKEVCLLERKLAFLEGKESLEPALERKEDKIEKLRDVIVGLREDLKMCNKVDGHLVLSPAQVCGRRRHCRDDDDDTSGTGA